MLDLSGFIAPVYHIARCRRIAEICTSDAPRGSLNNLDRDPERGAASIGCRRIDEHKRIEPALFDMSRVRYGFRKGFVHGRKLDRHLRMPRANLVDRLVVEPGLGQRRNDSRSDDNVVRHFAALSRLLV